MTDLFITPVHPDSLLRWEDLTTNERGWIEMIRVISQGSDPRIDLETVRAMREGLDRQRAVLPTIRWRNRSHHD